MQGRNMAVKASLVLFFGGLLWGMQVVLFHLNNLLPPAQSVHAFYAEKLSEGHYLVKILGEAVEVNLPGKEEVIWGVKECMQRIPVVADNLQKFDAQKLNKECRESLSEVRSQGLNIIQWLGRNYYVHIRNLFNHSAPDRFLIILHSIDAPHYIMI